MYGPKFTRFFPAIVRSLKEMGGSASTSEAIDRSIELLGISEDEQNAELASGSSRVRNQAQWARLYMVRGGILDASSRGIWQLTEKGSNVDESFDWRSLFREVQQEFSDERRKRQASEEDTQDDADSEIPIIDYRFHALQIVRSISPSGFERLCQRLLRESGFETVTVTVTGRSGDGGIDGIGTLQINPFVSFNVLFQCKRYSGSVSPSQIRDFRGAMQGRADKGLIITTGTFTVEAKREARRDGAPPIELVDGDDLIALFESLEFGLTARTTYDVDESFFSQYAE